MVNGQWAIGNVIEAGVATPGDGDSITAKADVYSQAIFIFQKIQRILIEACSSKKDVIRTGI